MRRDEKIVADALVQFFGGGDVVRARDGENPPDLYLDFANRSVPVEVTQLRQFTVASDGTLGNRTTDDELALRAIEDLHRRFGSALPAGTMLMVTAEMPSDSGARFRRELEAFVSEIAAAPIIGSEAKRVISGAPVRVSVYSDPVKGGRRIVGSAPNRYSSSDVALNVQLMLADRIRAKVKGCAGIAGPKWLAFLNTYWLATNDSVAAVARGLAEPHSFDRIFVVSAEGVTEL